MDKVIEGEHEPVTLKFEEHGYVNIMQEAKTMLGYSAPQKIRLTIESLLKIIPTTPATSWEEVLADIRNKLTPIANLIALVRKGKHSVHDVTLAENMVTQLSNLSAPSQPVSPTPMSETWEEVLEKIIDPDWGAGRANKDYDSSDEFNAFNEGFKQTIKYVLRLLNKHLPLPPSLHQVDRWVRVEDGLPDNTKEVLFYLASDNTRFGKFYKERLYGRKNVFISEQGAFYTTDSVVAWQYVDKPIGLSKPTHPHQ